MFYFQLPNQLHNGNTLRGVWITMNIREVTTTEFNLFLVVQIVVKNVERQTVTQNGLGKDFKNLKILTFVWPQQVIGGTENRMQKLFVPNDHQQFWLHFEWFLSLIQILDVKQLLSLFKLKVRKNGTFTQNSIMADFEGGRGQKARTYLQID